MNNIEIKKNLEDKIFNVLSLEINNDYIYLDLPYHDNSGDALIWQGTVDFLKRLAYKSYGSFSAETFNLPKLPDNVIILLHGGGNFGDLYPFYHQFKLSILNYYPENKIIFLPQTIYYKDLLNFREDMRVINEHKNIVFCARDKVTFKIFNEHKADHAKLLLLPDMAFCMSADWFDKAKKNTQKRLYIKRIDGELSNNESKLEINSFDRVADWPTYSDPETPEMKKMRFYLKWLGRFQRRLPIFVKPMKKIVNNYANQVFREHIVNQAITFINGYDIITTTRLHGCILSVLLGKEIILLDNSYGKNSNFYEAWLSEYYSIKLVSKENGYVN